MRCYKEAATIVCEDPSELPQQWSSLLSVFDLELGLHVATKDFLQRLQNCHRVSFDGLMEEGEVHGITVFGPIEGVVNMLPTTIPRPH